MVVVEERNETGTGSAFERGSSGSGGIKYGDALEARMSFDDTGAPVATVTASCDNWWLGRDASGLDVILDSGTGKVISPGLLHPGLPISALPDTLPAPFALAQ